MYPSSVCSCLMDPEPTRQLGRVRDHVTRFCLARAKVIDPCWKNTVKSVGMPTDSDPEKDTFEQAGKMSSV